MPDYICKICKAVVGRSKLKNGACKDALKCMELVKYQKEERKEERTSMRILDSKYFDKYRYKSRGTLRVTNKPRPEETGPEE